MEEFATSHLRGTILYQDVVFACPSTILAQSFAKKGNGAYRYMFAIPPASHAQDNAYEVRSVLDSKRMLTRSDIYAVPNLVSAPLSSLAHVLRILHGGDNLIYTHPKSECCPTTAC